MNRKNFLSSLLPVAGILSASPENSHLVIKEPAAIIPPYLQKGDVIGITSPAGYITKEAIQPAIDKLIEWGYQVIIGRTIGKRDFTFGGTDDDRRQDMEELLANKNIGAILCARGGYGSVRIIDQLDFSRIAADPKWIVGFSDITVIHNHLNRNYGVASIHSKMCNSFPDDWAQASAIQKETIESIRRCLEGEAMQYSFSPNNNNKKGVATGTLIGGNLKTIESLAGSKSDLVTKNKILFVEDTGEYLYSIDRMFWNLERTGKLQHLRGLVVGGFRVKKDDPGEEFGKTLEEIVLEKVAGYRYPVAFDFPVGHQVNNFALKCGMSHQLRVTADDCTLKETR